MDFDIAHSQNRVFEKWEVMRKTQTVRAFLDRCLFEQKIVFGKMSAFLGELSPFLGKPICFWEENAMYKRNYKGRCTKMKTRKAGLCKLYDALQVAYLRELEARTEVEAIEVNVPLDGTEYCTDFVCRKTDGKWMVRECVFRRHLMKPKTVTLLDLSREYWLQKGVTDYGIVIDEE